MTLSLIFVLVASTLFKLPKILTVSFAPPILITLLSLFETEPILILRVDWPIFKVPFILSKLICLAYK